MVIEKILKQLTPRRVKKEIEAIQKVKLPPEFQKWVEEYENKKIGDRSEFLWKWLYKADQVVIESFNVSKEYRNSIVEIACFFNMFINLIDDVSEKSKGKKLLDELLKIPFDRNCIKLNKLNKEEKIYLKFTMKVWCKLEKRFKKYPYYRKMRDLFEYDIYQLLNTTKYSYLIFQNPFWISKTEYWMYLPQNMQFIIAFDLYLMCSKFNFSDIGKLREIILHAQRMARIGNDMGTWEREVSNRDFTSGICAYAVDIGVLTVDELKKGDKLEIVKRIKDSKIEEKILEEWQRSYRKIKEINKKIKRNRLVNIRKFLSAIEKIAFYHILSRGHI